MSVLEKIDKYLNEATGKKRFYQLDNVGKAKYTVNFYDGVQKHKDGSDFFDMRIFKNKKDLNAFITKLRTDGYAEGK